MFYKNTSYSAKTFYGVTFNPGETKEVDGYINSKYMILAEEPTTEGNKTVQKEPSSDKSKKEASKPEESKQLDKETKGVAKVTEEKPSDNKEQKS